MEIVKLKDEIERMSHLATGIVREYYDPLLGEAQNTYMLKKFQSPRAIEEQIEHGAQYYFVIENEDAGFFAYYLYDTCLYLSKLYLKKECRGRGFGRCVIEFLKNAALNANLPAIELNVNKYNFDTIAAYERLGFKRIRDEVNDIGEGYVMDDYVYRLEI